MVISMGKKDFEKLWTEHKLWQDTCNHVFGTDPITHWTRIREHDRDREIEGGLYQNDDSWCSVDRDGSVLRRWWVYGYIRQRGDGSPVHIATINRGVDEVFFFHLVFVCIHGDLMDRGWRGDQPREGCCFHGSLTLEDIYFYVPKNGTLFPVAQGLWFGIHQIPAVSNRIKCKSILLADMGAKFIGTPLCLVSHWVSLSCKVYYKPSFIYFWKLCCMFCVMLHHLMRQGWTLPCPKVPATWKHWSYDVAWSLSNYQSQSINGCWIRYVLWWNQSL